MIKTNLVFHWCPDTWGYQLLWFDDALTYKKELKALGYWWNSSRLRWQKRVRADTYAKEVEKVASLGAVYSLTGSDVSASHSDLLKLINKAKEYHGQLSDEPEQREEIITAPDLVEGVGWDGVIYGKNFIFLGQEKVTITEEQKLELMEYANKMKKANATKF